SVFTTIRRTPIRAGCWPHSETAIVSIRKESHRRLLRMTDLLMQLLEGETLRELIASRSLDVATALSLAIQVADAVDAADGKGIIHRDIKPANIFVTATLTDLGLSIELTIETGSLYIGSATRTDTACTGLKRPKPGRTDIEMIGMASVAPTIQRLPTSASG